MMRWGFPPLLNHGIAPVTNARNLKSPYWRGWLKAEWRRQRHSASGPTAVLTRTLFETYRHTREVEVHFVAHLGFVQLNQRAFLVLQLRHSVAADDRKAHRPRPVCTGYISRASQIVDD